MVVPNAPFYNNAIRPSSAGGPPADRQSSAFGILPSHHAPTAPFEYQGNPHHAGPLGLNTNMPPPNGRGGLPPSRDYEDGSVSAGWEPQSQMSFRSRDSSLGGYGAPAQNPDQGWNRPAQGPPTNFNQPQPLPFSGTGYGPDPSRMSVSRQGANPAITRRDPSANQQFQRPERGSSMTPVNPTLSPPTQRQDRFGSASPMNSRSSSPGQSGFNRASPRPLQQQTMSSQPSPKPTQMPPQKRTGPSTFEEMGIPAAKNESDCVSIPAIPVT
jgi:hypothetical protein